MKRPLVIATIAVVIIAAAAGAYLRFGVRQAPAAVVPTGTVTRTSLAATLNAAGNIAAHQIADLSFGQSGTVKTIAIAVGDRVTAGQVLAELDTADLDLQVRNAQVNLKTAQAKLAQTRNPSTAQDIASARARVESAAAAFDKVKAGASQSDLAAAQAQVASAQAAYNAAVQSAGAPNSQLQSAAAGLEKARIALQTAQAAYDRVAWRSDEAGTSQATDLQNATIDYASAKASYEALAATTQPDSDSKLASARSSLQQAQANLSKLKSQVTEADVISAQSSLTQAQNDLDKLLAGPDANALDIAQSSVEQAEIALDQARLKLQQAQLTAPFDGVITQLSIRLGQNASGSAIQIADLDHLEIVVNMAEIDVNRARPGQEAEITLDALPDVTLHGTVSQIAPAGVQTQGVVNYPVTVALDGPSAGVKTGMTANLNIIIDRRDNVLAVPNRAVRTVARQKIVTVLFEGQEIQVPVQAGLSNDTVTEITNGLKEGDVVLLSPTTTTTQSRGGGFGPLGGFGGPPIGR